MQRWWTRERSQDTLLPVMIVDLVLTVARGAAELPAFAALLGVRLADPRVECPDQLGTVRPQIGVIAGIRAERVARAMIFAHAAWLAGHVRQAQAAPVVPTAKQKYAGYLLHSTAEK